MIRILCEYEELNSQNNSDFYCPEYPLKMLSYKLIYIFLLIQSLIPIVFASIDNDCSCPKEKIFESSVKEGVIKSPGCKYWNN